MRRFVPLLFILTTALPAFVSAQSVTSNPVGFETTVVGAGKIGALSIPLDKVAEFASAVSTVGANTIQTTGAGWTANQFAPFASNPHVIRMLTGTSAGRQFIISSNTTDTVTLTTTLPGVSAGDQYQIMGVQTLASLFGATAPDLNRNANPNLADNVLIRGTSGYLTYYNDGMKWLIVGGDGETPENNTALLPENGLLLSRRTGNYSFTNLGAVPVTNLVTDIPGNKITLFANRFPVNTTLVNLGLHTQPGWNANANANLADNVLLRGVSGWLTYYYDGAKWLVVGGDGETPENPQIALGTSVLIVRRAGPTITLNQAKPY